MSCYLSNLIKAEDPKAYAKLANEGVLLGYPVKIGGQHARPDNGIHYHSSIKYFDKEKDHPHSVHALARHLPLNPPDAKNTQIGFNKFQDRLGNDVHVITLHGNSAEKLKEHNGKFAHMGFPSKFEWTPHISVDRATHDRLKASGAKTAHEAGIEFGPAELKRGPKTLKTYHHKPDTTEPAVPDESDFTAKVMAKSEMSLPEDEDSHALLNRQEDKYFLPSSHLEEAIATISERLALGDIDTDTRYNTNRTIYMDDKDLTSLKDCVSKKKPRLKVRIRQYCPNSKEWENVAYAEFKMKEEDGYTKKIRVRIPASSIEQLADGGQIAFNENLVNINKDIERKMLEVRVQAINSAILRKGLRKQLEVRYERRAYTGKNLRITIDENLRFMDAKTVDPLIREGVESADGWNDFLSSYVMASWKNPLIMEIKSDSEVPSWVKHLIKDCKAKKASFSKYCAAMIAHFKTDHVEGTVLGNFGFSEDIDEFEKSENTFGAKPLMKPYVSEAQRRWAHTASGKEALGGNAGVHEWDEATKGKKLPERVGKSLEKRENVNIAVVVLRDGNFVLIGRRRRNNKWGLPGGRCESGEDTKVAALRELEEEAGLKLDPDKLMLAGIREIRGGGENKRVHVYMAEYPGGVPTTEEDPDEEFTKWKWVRCEDNQLPDEILDDDMTPPAEAAFDELDMAKNLEKGALKNVGMALGMAGALAAAPHPGGTIEHGPGYDHHKMLNAISQVESSGGKNTHHKPMNNGMSAYGKYALTPNTIQDTIRSNPDLKAKYGKALALKGDNIHHYMADNKGLEDIIADRHLKHLENHFGNNLSDLGVSWLNGVTGTNKAKKGGKDLSNHWYAKKIKENYGKGK